jgi:hypothetical protein
MVDLKKERSFWLLSFDVFFGFIDVLCRHHHISFGRIQPLLCPFSCRSNSSTMNRLI